MVKVARSPISVLFAVSEMACCRGWGGIRRFVLLAWIFVAMFCRLPALPPQHGGVPAFLIGVGSPGAALICCCRVLASCRAKSTNRGRAELPVHSAGPPGGVIVAA